jgi:uncharacterized membrane protein YkoI
METRTKILLSAATVSAAAFGAAAVAGAASPTKTSTTTTTTQSPTFPTHGSAAHEDAEKPVTGADATRAQAAAVKAAGGGTAGAVTTDVHGDGYEVTITTSDGTTTEIHLDSSFNVQQGRGGRGDFGGPPHGDAAHEDAEKPVTGTDAAKAQAAAVEAAGGGTAGAVTTDFGGDGYEVTVTKSDGTTTEIHLDSSFNVQGSPGDQGY